MPADAQVEIGYVGHATTTIAMGRTLVLTDPFLRDRLGPLARHGPSPAGVRDLDVDLVLISHGHPDHFDLPSLRSIRGSPTVVVPRGLGTRVRAAVRGEVIEVVAGDRVTVAGVALEVVQAAHWITPGAPRAQPVGFVVGAGPRIYFAGDTGRFAGLTGILADADVALLPVWTWGPHRGPGHLGPRTAAESLSGAGPTVAVPIHWGTLYPRRLDRVWSAPLREPGDRFADDARLAAPLADIRVLRPGEHTTVGDAPGAQQASNT